ncbi:hypothetical protein HPB48_017670 [Haemaphysalis longicornis]|uniref:Uncharacterized protein n=1 Tax=Haemaphysalis longicornis TaxID=44386 RepID=A0A9J6FV46_HAELO|nr:hypothetical protein HPB48_017670 [Haemaphysalis longicornis]
MQVGALLCFRAFAFSRSLPLRSADRPVRHSCSRDVSRYSYPENPFRAGLPATLLYCFRCSIPPSIAPQLSSFTSSSSSVSASYVFALVMRLFFRLLVRRRAGPVYLPSVPSAFADGRAPNAESGPPGPLFESRS